jgi:hypothetical protein
MLRLAVRPSSVPALSDAVCDVVGIRPKEEMVRTDACRIVAPVAHE